MAEKLPLQKKLEQGRAEFAYKCAENGAQINKKKEYKSYVKKIPMLVKTNGLGAALAFVKAKSDKNKDKHGYAYHLIYEQTTGWLKQEPKGLISGRLENEDLAKVLTDLNSPEYRAVTNEVLAFFVWLKRFAEGLIEGVAND